MTDATPREALLSLLRDGADWDPFYPTLTMGELTDHLPMALQALWRLGATPAQMQTFQSSYQTKLVPVKQHESVDVSGTDWRRWLGDWRIYRPLRARLLTELATKGRDAVLRDWLPPLVDCPAIDALHPLIRVGYGIEQRIDAEIAAGIAYWAAVHVRGAAIAGSPMAGDAAALFARVRDTTTLTGIKFRSGRFRDRLEQINAAPAFAAASAWRSPSVDLAALAREAARIYLSTRDFFALHMVTGTHALRMLAPYVDDQQLLLNRAWQTLAATYLIIGAPTYAFTERDVALPTDAQLLEAGLRAKDDNEHVIKLAHSAREEFTQWRLPEHAMILAAIVQRDRG